MTPLEIIRENQRREREAKRRERAKLPPRKPAPTEVKAEIERIRERAAKKGQR